MDITWRVISRGVRGEERGREGEKVQGIRSINGRYKIDREVKNSRGNGEAKELICTAHGHELRREIAGGKVGTRQRGQRNKNWDNCNSINNKK